MTVPLRLPLAAGAGCAANAKPAARGWSSTRVYCPPALLRLPRIDAIVPPGADVARLEGAAYSPPSITLASLRRRPLAERAAA
jgi:hypothetical protein